jgi:hypothetical protein
MRDERPRLSRSGKELMGLVEKRGKNCPARLALKTLAIRPKIAFRRGGDRVQPDGQARQSHRPPQS